MITQGFSGLSIKCKIKDGEALPYDSCFCACWVLFECALYFSCANPVATDIYNIIYPASDPVVPTGKGSDQHGMTAWFPTDTFKAGLKPGLSCEAFAEI